MFISFCTCRCEEWICYTDPYNFGGFIDGLVTFTFAVSGKLMGKLDLGDLDPALQDRSILRLTSTPTLSQAHFYPVNFLLVIDYPWL